MYANNDALATELEGCQVRRRRIKFWQMPFRRRHTAANWTVTFADIANIFGCPERPVLLRLRVSCHRLYLSLIPWAHIGYCCKRHGRGGPQRKEQVVDCCSTDALFC